jgi:hypothetical protein
MTFGDSTGGGGGTLDFIADLGLSGYAGASWQASQPCKEAGENALTPICLQTGPGLRRDES